jgi:two-component system, OmpR family, sensor histidine kinase BaeS
MNRHLILKLLAIHLVVIAFVMLAVWLSINTLAAGYFVTLMEKYNISPEPAHRMFVEAVHRHLIWASLAAAILAIGLSFVMMRKALAPLMRMTAIAAQIAAGDFSVRVPASGRDEVGQLAQAFNRMAASLEKIENLRRNLMIDVAHELRTPLTNIRGYLEALSDGILPPSPETLTVLQDETMRLIRLAEDVLELARADAARSRLDREPVDLRAEIEAALAVFSLTFAQNAVAVKVHGPDRVPAVSADRRRVARVLRCLTENAAQYAPPRGHLNIRIAANAERVRVEYSNDGGEITAADLPYIFERFYRGEKSRSRQHGGAGIGLAIVKEVVDAHGGRVGADLSDATVRIWLELPTGPSSSGV